MVKRDLIRYIGIVITVILAILSLNKWVFESVTIDKQMANTYLKKGDRILVNVQGKPTYGDFVLYRVDGKDHVGRIIAKEGDSVRYMDNILYLNDQIKHESYLSQETTTDDFSTAKLPKSQSEKIGKNSYLILNDRRSNTADSRTYGLIKKEQIIGKLSFRLNPLDKMGFVENGVAD